MKKFLLDIVSKLRINSSREYLDQFTKEAALSLPAGAKVLDAGAGKCLYKKHFRDHSYETADFCQIDKKYGEITYVCDLSEIPVPSQKYDLVLLTQVLEHLPEPEKVLIELNRVLQPGGELWLSTPLYYEEHEIPYDFYRYTQYGLQHLLHKTGYKVKRIEWLEGYYGTLAYQLAGAARSLPWKPKYYGGGLLGIVLSLGAVFSKVNYGISSIILSRLDLHYKFTLSGHCKNYTIIAVKTTSDE